MLAWMVPRDRYILLNVGKSIVATLNFLFRVSLHFARGVAPLAARVVGDRTRITLAVGSRGPIAMSGIARSGKLSLDIGLNGVTLDCWLVLVYVRFGWGARCSVLFVFGALLTVVDTQSLGVGRVLGVFLGLRLVSAWGRVLFLSGLSFDC